MAIGQTEEFHIKIRFYANLVNIFENKEIELMIPDNLAIKDIILQLKKYNLKASEFIQKFFSLEFKQIQSYIKIQKSSEKSKNITSLDQRIYEDNTIIHIFPPLGGG